MLVAAFGPSYLQQKIGNLKVSHLRESNAVLNEVRKLPTKITFLSPGSYEQPRYLGFSDAAQQKSSYGQTGYISGITFGFCDHPIFLAIDWQSRLSFLQSVRKS